MRTQQSIFLKMIYADVDSKRFIKSQPYTVLAQAGERRRLPLPFSFFQNFLKYA
jgi:hypothetical protein